MEPKLFDTKLLVKLVGAAVAIIAVLFLIFGSVYTIGQNEGAIIRNTFTGSLHEIKTAGLKLKNPIGDDVETYTLHQKTMNNVIHGNTLDNVQVKFNLRTIYQIKDGMATFRELGTLDDETIQGRIDTYVSKIADMVANKYNYVDARSKLSTVGDEMTSYVAKMVHDKFPGVEIDQVVIDDIDAPDSIEDAINKKISQKQAADASVYEKEKAQNEADAQNIKKSVGEEQQKIEICAKNPSSYACLPSGVTVIGGNALVDPNSK